MDQYWVNLLTPMDLRLAEAILERVEWSVERSADAWGAFFLLTDPCWGDLDSPDIRGSGLHETKDNNFENWYQLSACDGHHITSFDSERSINTMRFNTYDDANILNSLGQIKKNTESGLLIRIWLTEYHAVKIFKLLERGRSVIINVLLTCLRK